MCVYFSFDSSGVKSHEVPSGQFPIGPLGGWRETVDAAAYLISLPCSFSVELLSC